jgi:hypothetical protein
MDVTGPVVGVPLGHGDEVALLVRGRAGRRLERADEGVTGELAFRKFVVDFRIVSFVR